MRLFIKADQLDLFAPRPTAPKPPTGFTPIPGSKHGGYHKQTADGYAYWYPGTGVVGPGAAHHGDVQQVEGPGPTKPAEAPAAPPAQPGGVTVVRRTREGKEVPISATPPATPPENPPSAPAAPEGPPLVVAPEVSSVAGREFRDYGGLIEGSRLALSKMTREDMAKDPLLARKLVTKANVFGVWKTEWAEADQANGVSPVAAHMKRAILELVADRPYDSVEMRDDYRAGAKALLDGLSRCKDSGDIEAFLAEWEDAASGFEKSGYRFRPGPSISPEPWSKYTGRDPKDGEWREDAVGYHPVPPGHYARPIMQYSVFEDGEWRPMTVAQDSARIFALVNAWSNYPSRRHGLQDSLGIRGWAKFVGGGVEALVTLPEGSSKTQYGRYTLALGDRFAKIVGHTVSRRRWAIRLEVYRRPVRSAAAQWSSGFRSPSGGTASVGDLVSAGEKAVLGDDPWAWAARGQGGKAPKTEKPPKVVERGDKNWVWSRPTAVVSREGPPVKKPADSEEFAKAFGFPQVNYGKWNSEAEREWHTDNAYAALHDLADTVGIPATMLGINARLKLAFGARGTGGLRAPVAHYEPATRAINLTKLNGAGSLAHEWGHFLDHAIVMGSGGQVGGKAVHLSENAPQPTSRVGDVPQPIVEAMWNVMQTIKYVSETDDQRKARVARAIEDRDHARDEIDRLDSKLKPFRMKAKRGSLTEEDQAQYTALAKQYNAAVLAFNAALKVHHSVETDHFREANALGGNYYNSDAELFARAFESYIEDQLSDHGRKNTYLVHGTRFGDPGIYVAPDHPHRAQCNAAIGALLKVLRDHDQFAKALAHAEWFQGLMAEIQA